MVYLEYNPVAFNTHPAGQVTTARLIGRNRVERSFEGTQYLPLDDCESAGVDGDFERVKANHEARFGAG